MDQKSVTRATRDNYLMENSLNSSPKDEDSTFNKPIYSLSYDSLNLLFQNFPTAKCHSEFKFKSAPQSTRITFLDQYIDVITYTEMITKYLLDRHVDELKNPDTSKPVKKILEVTDSKKLKDFIQDFKKLRNIVFNLPQMDLICLIKIKPSIRGLTLSIKRKDSSSLSNTRNKNIFLLDSKNGQDNDSIIGASSMYTATTATTDTMNTDLTPISEQESRIGGEKSTIVSSQNTELKSVGPSGAGANNGPVSINPNAKFVDVFHPQKLESEEVKILENYFQVKVLNNNFNCFKTFFEILMQPVDICREFIHLMALEMNILQSMRDQYKTRQEKVLNGFKPVTQVDETNWQPSELSQYLGLKWDVSLCIGKV